MIEFTIREVPGPGGRTMSSIFRNRAEAFRRYNLAVAKKVLAESHRRVPFRRGDLHDTGKVVQSGEEAKITYGDSRVDYAPETHAKPYNYGRGRENRYLEKAMRAVAQDSGKLADAGKEFMAGLK